MYCRSCGTQNDDNAFKCIQCGEVLQYVQQANVPVGSVPTYLAPSILVTIFCCWPFGIVSIVYAAQVNGKLAAGDYAGAVEASGKAKTWCWLSFGLGLTVVVLYLLFIIIIAASDM